MLNYIKSELYRVTHSRAAYIAVFILCAGALTINLALYFWGSGPDYYSNTAFSYSMLLFMPSVFYLCGAIVAALLYDGSLRNGNLKNTLAFGMTRVQVFCAQTIVAVITATILLAVVIGVWIASAELLLGHIDSWNALDLLRVCALMYPIAVASLLTVLVGFSLFQRDLTTVLGWLCIWSLLPQLCAALGLKFPIFADIARWMPNQFLSFGDLTLWWTDGFYIQHCLVSGGVGILVFFLAGVVSLRKRDLT